MADVWITNVSHQKLTMTANIVLECKLDCHCGAEAAASSLSPALISLVHSVLRCCCPPEPASTPLLQRCSREREGESRCIPRSTGGFSRRRCRWQGKRGGKGKIVRLYGSSFFLTAF